MPTTLVEQQHLADMVREDGHEVCAIIIEESPQILLPSVLRWAAWHCKSHVIYDDEAARELVDILRWESEVRQVHRPTLTNRRAMLLLVGIMLSAYALDWFWYLTDPR